MYGTITYLEGKAHLANGSVTAAFWHVPKNHNRPETVCRLNASYHRASVMVRTAFGLVIDVLWLRREILVTLLASPMTTWMYDRGRTEWAGVR